MKNILLSISTFSFLIIELSCAGRCGPSNYIPTGPEDCVGYSNSTTYCCYLTMRDAPANYNICYWLDKTDVTPIISIGKLSYRVDCEDKANMADFNNSFPLENIYSPCGVQNPMSPKDCWPYGTGSGACCMAGSNPNMNGDDDPFCYFFPEAKFEKINFTVDANVPGLKYYVSCQGSYIKGIYISKLIFIVMLLNFII